MYKMLSELKTQYWFWFVRNQLIAYELNDLTHNNGELSLRVAMRCKRKGISSLTRHKAKLEELVANPIKKRIYSRAVMSEWVSELCNYDDEISGPFAEGGDKFKNGSLKAPDELVKDLDEFIPGSLSAYEKGPCNLFLILEAETLVESIMIIARELLNTLEASIEVIKNDSQLANLTEDLSSQIKLNIFGGSIKLLKTIEDIINSLFPCNQWNKFSSVIPIATKELETLNPKSLRQPQYIDIEYVLPIVIGFAFFRARFFDEVHYLSRVCYEEQYLKLLNYKFLMKEDLWRFDTKRGQKVDLTSQCYDESNIKTLFQQSFVLSNPPLFANATVLNN